MKRGLCLPFVFCFVLLTGCVSYTETKKVKATVTEVSYTTSETVYKTANEEIKKKTHPAKYNVTLQYKGITTKFNRKSLYDKVKEGQQIEVVLEQGYAEDGKLLVEWIRLSNYKYPTDNPQRDSSEETNNDKHKD